MDALEEIRYVVAKSKQIKLPSDMTYRLIKGVLDYYNRTFVTENPDSMVKEKSDD